MTSPSRLSRLMLDTFTIEPPVKVQGPYPYNYVSSPGSLTLLQIQYEAGTGADIKNLSITWDNACATPVEVVQYYRRAAFLNEHPQTGPTAGAGFIGVFVKSVSAGLSSIIAHIQFTDGSYFEVPLIMYVT
jgi:hypothetical protein